MDKMNATRLLKHLKFEEGCNLEAHDVQGKMHIGYGRCLDTKGISDDERDMMGLPQRQDIAKINQSQAEYLLAQDILDATDDAKAVAKEYGYWDTLTAPRQEALVSMAFNLGRAGLAKFKKMHTALAAKLYINASAEMLDSKAAREDAPARYRRLAFVMERGRWQKTPTTS